MSGVFRVEFGLLGPLSVEAGSTPISVSAKQQRVLLAALLLNAPGVVSVEVLAELVWDGRPPTRYRAALHTAVQRLRATLGFGNAGLIRTIPPGYTIEVGAGDFDVFRFEALADRGRTAAADGDWITAADLLRQALALWRGDALADITARTLHQRYGDALSEQRLQVLTARIEADLRLGRHEELIGELTRLIAEHRLWERFYGQLMLALYRAGRVSDALAVYQRLRRTLADELGTDPAPEVQVLHRQILQSERLDPGREPAEEPSGAPVAAPLVPAQLPAGPRHFVGRARELKALDALLDRRVAGRPGTVTVAAIDGSAGVGKTAFALHWAHQAASRFPDGQLYVNLRGFDPTGQPLRPSDALRTFFAALDFPPARIPGTLEAQAGLYRSLLAGKRMLVVLDNARDADQVRSLLPASPGCLVLVTSRRRLTGLIATEGAHRLPLDLLSPGEARELLAGQLGAEPVERDPDAAAALVEACARLPLALTIAAAYSACNPQKPLAAIARQLREAGLNTFATGDPATDIRTVFSWSYATLPAGAQRTFRFLGLHPGPDITLPAAAALTDTDPATVDGHLEHLVQAQLLTEEAPGRYAFHDLLRAYATEQARARDNPIDWHGALRRIFDFYLCTAREAQSMLRPSIDCLVPPSPPRPDVVPEPFTDTRQAWAWFEAEHKVLLGVVTMAARTGFDVHTWQVAWTLVTFFERRGHWHDLAVVQRTALDTAQRSGDLAGQAHAHHMLGRLYARRGDHEKAGDHFGASLEQFRQLGDVVGQALGHHTFAEVHERAGRDRKAVAHAEQALELFSSAGHEIGKAQARSALGWYRSRLGDRQARQDCEWAVRRLAELGDKPGEAEAWARLGAVHHDAGQYPEAARCFRRAAGLFRQLGARYCEAATLMRLGDAQQATGDRPAARESWRGALSLLDDLGHPDAEQVRERLSPVAVRGVPA